ncbi:MAG: hypothetical protein P8L39_16775 [Halioglobus sp.]|nr:hypothetical protein [Halioglobus sp.]
MIEVQSLTRLYDSNPAVDDVSFNIGNDELATREVQTVITIQSLAGEVTLKLVTIDSRHFIYSSKYPFFFKISACYFDHLTRGYFCLISDIEDEEWLTARESR